MFRHCARTILIQFGSILPVVCACVFLQGVSVASAQTSEEEHPASALISAIRDRDVTKVSALLAAGAKPGQAGKFEQTPLHWAAYLENSAILTLLLDAGADPNTRTDTGVTPLELAINQNNQQLVLPLLAAGSDANTLNLAGESMLMLAAAKGNTSIITSLLEQGAAADYRDPHYAQTALMFAVRAGHLAATNLLLKAGANPNASTIIGTTPKFIAANSVPGFGFGEGIIRGGVPADRGRREPIPGGMTPLLMAARHGHSDIARTLLEHGADLDKAEANDIFPLLMAISNAHVDTALFLLDQGALLNGQDWYGRSPLWEAVNVRNLYVHNATFENHIDRAPFLPLITALLKAGAEVNARTRETPPFRHYLLEITGSLEWVDFTGQTAFISAALAGDITVMKLLLEYGADPHINTIEGTTPLMAAAGVNWVVAQTWTEGPAQLLEAVQLCYELGIDVNHVNSMGLAAIHGAANRGSNDIIEFLVSKGASLNIRDKVGRTPLDWAKGVFLATHPAEPKPDSVALISRLLKEER